MSRERHSSSIRTLEDSTSNIEGEVSILISKLIDIVFISTIILVASDDIRTVIEIV